MVKVLVLTSKGRVGKFFDINTLPKDWELVYGEALKTDEELLNLAGDADFIFVDAIREISKHLIDQMPNLKLIHSEGVAYNKIDTEAAKAKNVFVCNNAGANAPAVAEHAVMLMIGLLRRLLEGDMMVRTGKQIEAKGSFILDGITEISACHVGFVGFGVIAKETAKRLKPFGCKMSCFDIYRNEDAEKQLGVAYMPVEELLKECDIISLHLPVTKDTENFINEERLALMKSNALIINTARGEIVDQDALAKALVQGKVAGLGTDTLNPEPVTLDNPLLNLPSEHRYKVLFTPHIAGTTLQAFATMHKTSWENMMSVIKGDRPKNIVNQM